MVFLGYIILSPIIKFISATKDGLTIGLTLSDVKYTGYSSSPIKSIRFCDVYVPYLVVAHTLKLYEDYQTDRTRVFKIGIQLNIFSSVVIDCFFFLLLDGLLFANIFSSGPEWVCGVQRLQSGNW